MEPVEIERRNRCSGIVGADDVEVLDVKENRSSSTIAFKITYDLHQPILGPDELAKVADATRGRRTFDADTTRRTASESASNLDQIAMERE